MTIWGCPCCSAIHFPLPGHVQDFHLRERAHGAQTKRAPLGAHTKNKKCRKNGTFFYGVICVNVEHFLLDFLSWSSVISVSVSSSMVVLSSQYHHVITKRSLYTYALSNPKPPTAVQSRFYYAFGRCDPTGSKARQGILFNRRYRIRK